MTHQFDVLRIEQSLGRLAGASIALLLLLLPAAATLIGILVLRQMPSLTDCAGIAAVVAGVAIHRES